MWMIRWLAARLRYQGSRSGVLTHKLPQDLQFEVLVRAHGDWLALLATILERERVMSANELARALADFAATTAPDRPEEGRILSFWASCLQDAAANFEDFPSAL